MDNLQLSQGGCFNLVSAAIAKHASHINLVIAVGTLAHVIDGRFYTRAAVASQAWTVSGEPGPVSDGTFTGSARSATNAAGTAVVGSSRIYGLFMNAAGTLKVVSGPIVDRAALAVGAAALHFPPPLKDYVCFGAVRIDITTAGVSFTPGVTALNATGITPTYIDLFSIPGAPLTS